MKKVWCVYTMEFYSAIRKDGTLPFVKTQVDLENSMLRAISQSGKSKNHMISLVWNVKLKLLDTDDSMVVTRRKGWG